MRAALADFLEAAADAATTVGQIAVAPASDEKSRVEAHLAELEHRRHHLSTLLIVDPTTDPA